MKKIILLPAFLILAACTKSFETTELDNEVQKPVAANQNAKTYAEWHASSDNPEKLGAELAKKVLSKEITTDQVCASFEKLSITDLTIYENQIRQKETSFIFKGCQEDLIKKLDDHWNNERKSLGIPLKRSSSNRLSRFLEKGAQGIVAGETKLEETAPKVHRFAEVVYVERDVTEGYFAVAGDLPAGQVALTFDDGPHELYTQEVLQALDDANVKATFFVMGNNIKKNPDRLRDIAKAGHSIGSHTQTHLCQASSSICESNNGGKRLTYAEAVRDMSSAHKLIKDILGWVSPFFRFPYGEGSIELKEFLKKTGTGEFYWNIDSNDWRSYKVNPDKNNKEKIPYTTQDMIENVMREVKSRKRGIILNHDIQKKTAVGLPALLNRLFDEGFQPVVFIPTDKTSILSSGMLKAVYGETNKE